MIEIGTIVKDISLPTTGETFLLSNFRGKFLLLYFYPKDNTPGCTLEGQDFTALYPQFQAQDCEIIGVSRDSVRVHENFRKKHQFPFHLLADTDEKLCNAFAVIQEKKLYGRTYMGIVRSTFLINPEGKIAAIWDKVKAKGHAQIVLDKLIELNT